jgi:PAS domain S-box-containing protein
MATILVIDDTPTNRDLLRTVLGYKNHRILEASDGQEGLEMVRAERPDLVIADILMPRMDGYEMVHRLRADPQLADTRVIFYTATYLKAEALKLAHACGVSHLIVKPSDPQDILDTVDAVLNESGPLAVGDLSEIFDREHLRLMTDKLAQKVQELENSNHRLIEEADQRQRAEDALRSSEARMRAVLNAAIDSIITVDSAGNVVELNPAAEAMFGYPRQSIIGRTLACFIFPYSDRLPRGLQQHIASHASTAIGKRIEITAINVQGVEFPIELTVAHILSGRPPLFTAYIRDLREQKAREEIHRRSEELEKQNQYVLEATRLKSEFLANMSHELRTPLNAIIGFSEMVHDGKIGAVSADQKECLGEVLASSHHLLELIDDILDLSKVEAGKMVFAPETLQLSTIIRDISGALKPLLDKKQLDLQFELDASLTEVFIDLRSFRQVLYNYLSNAVKFTPPNGRIWVRSRLEPPGHFCIEVEDTGIGICSEDVGKLFQTFEQLDSSATKEHKGTGLGLALTKRLVEAQGGRVGVRSASGQGSVFYAVLPRVAQTGDEICEAYPGRQIIEL